MYELTATRLRDALSAKGYTQQELADLSGVNKASISQYINGSHAPGNISAHKMAKYLGVSAEYLMGFEEVPPTPENAHFLADLMKDPVTFSYIRKIAVLDERKKESLFDYIDFLSGPM